MNRRQVLGVVALVLSLLAIGALPAVVAYKIGHESQARALTQAAAGRRGIAVAVADSQRKTCRSLVAVWGKQRRAASLIASDPFQSTRTRRARGAEALVLAKAIRREAGWPANCRKAHPSPPFMQPAAR